MTTALLFLAAAAAPVTAAPPAPAAPIAMPRELADPAMADKIGRMMGAMTKAVMDMPVGVMEAAIEGRPATRADRNKRVRDVTGVNDRAVIDRVASNSAATGRAVQAAGKAVFAALPAIMDAMRTAEDEIGRAAANLPDPTYPRR